jgi:ribonuclease HI
MIFEGLEANMGRLTHRIKISFGEGRKPLKQSCPRIPRAPNIDQSISWGFFDGACQGSPGECGVGAILFLKSSHHFSLKYGVGLDTNNRAELYALWILLKVVLEQKVKRIQILGDSKLVLDWANGKSNITNMLLRPIMDRIQVLKGDFDEIYFIHVYREFNHKAYTLSKEALTVQEGVLIEQEVKDNTPQEVVQKVLI